MAPTFESSTPNPYKAPWDDESAKGVANSAPIAREEADRLSDLSPQQWKSGLAAWLGWLFDGLDMHLYTIVAAPFVAQLLSVDLRDPSVGRHSSWIQAAFLVGWALGGGFFGRVGDLLGRSRALMLTILTYAVFTGLSFVATTWWHLLIFRFLAALGIGGEWAVGASLISETWPRHWRPWLAAILQTAVNLGSMLAGLVGYLIALSVEQHVLPDALQYRSVFLVGVLPALLVLWIRRAVPEPPEWHTARESAELSGDTAMPGAIELFRGPIARITLLTILVCALSLSGHWAFMFWCSQQLRNLPDLADWSKEEQQKFVGLALNVVMISSIVGNFAAALVARLTGYRTAITALCLTYAAGMISGYCVPRSHNELWGFLVVIGLSQGLFGLFTMYLPPLFPVLLRTTGAGFCYNIGRIAAAAGTVFFGSFATVGDYRIPLLYAGFLFLPAACVAFFLPEPPDEVAA
jgi:MFS family permease